MPYKKSWRRLGRSIEDLWDISFLILLMNVFSVLSLTCHPAEYKVNEECCPKCPPGNRVKTHCTEYRSTSCLPCITGSFMDEPTGKEQCFPCTSCDRGSGLRIKTSCTTMSNAVCEPLDGFYCTDYDEDKCITAQKHTRCQPGQYIRHKGTATADTVCTDCSSGTFSNGTFSSCQSHTKCESLMKAGTASTDAECGEPSSNTTVIVAVVSAVVPLVAIIIGLVILKRKYLHGRGDAPSNREVHSVSNSEAVPLSQKDQERGRKDPDVPTQESLIENETPSVRRVPG